jgi:hypothetical protein
LWQDALSACECNPCRSLREVCLEVNRLRAENKRLRNDLTGRTLSARAAGSMMLSVQDDCIAERQRGNHLRDALRELVGASDLPNSDRWDAALDRARALLKEDGR